MILSIFSTGVVRAGAPSCAAVFREKPALERRESAIEVEIDAAPHVIDLFETLDGTIAPVLGKSGLKAIPEEILRELQDYVGPKGNPLLAPWDLLSPSEKAEVIMRAAQKRKANFFKDRKVPGLRYRPSVQLSFTKATRFLGRDFPAGNHTFKTEDIFATTAIEYMGNNRMKKDLGFELHVRSDLPVGENYLTSRVLQQTLVGSVNNVHSHIIGPLPPAISKEPTSLFRATDFIRRATLFFDIEMIKNGIPMQVLENSSGSANFFPTQPNEFYEFIEALSKQRKDKLAAGYSKSGTVGLRTSHFYDGKDIWGIEVRYLSPKMDAVRTAQKLSVLQEMMNDQSYFLSPEEVNEYLKAHPLADAKDPYELTSRLLYAHAGPLNLARSPLSKEVKKFLRKAVEENDFVEMLFFDWSTDIMFYNKPARIKQIQDAQQYALQLLLRGVPSTEVMKIFVKKSALAYELDQQTQPRP